jgi:hypothetical protein
MVWAIRTPALSSGWKTTDPKGREDHGACMAAMVVAGIRRSLTWKLPFAMLMASLTCRTTTSIRNWEGKCVKDETTPPIHYQPESLYSFDLSLADMLGRVFRDMVAMDYPSPPEREVLEEMAEGFEFYVRNRSDGEKIDEAWLKVNRSFALLADNYPVLWY